MKNNKKVDIVLALIIALGIWAYVIGETNPVDTKTFRFVPITLVNEETLDANNLAVLDISSTTVDVTVKGTRVALSQIKDGDITATVNMDDAVIGHNELRLDVTAPENVEIEDKSINKVVVNVETKVTRTVDVVVTFDGEFKHEKEPLIVDQGMNSVTISGAESRINTVDHVNAVVPSEKVTDELKTISCDLVPVDSKERRVEPVRLSENETKITTKLVEVKTVPLDVPVVDNSEDGAMRHVSVPKTVTVKGGSSELEKIDKLTSEPVDVSEINEDTTLQIEIKLPEGVEISEQSVAMRAEITIEKPDEKNFTFSSDDVELQNVGEGLKAAAESAEITVTVRGKGKDLENLAKGDIKLSADLSGYKTGAYTVTIKVKAGSDLRAEADPESIKINIE